MDERIKKILQWLADNGHALLDSEYAVCVMCDGDMAHTKECIVTLAEQVLAELPTEAHAQAGNG